MDPVIGNYKRPDTLESIRNCLIDIVLLALVFLGLTDGKQGEVLIRMNRECGTDVL